MAVTATMILKGVMSADEEGNNDDNDNDDDDH